MKLAVIGATGMVGEVMLKVLAERSFQYDELCLVASERSVGNIIQYQGNDHVVMSLQSAVDAKPDIAIFSAGGQTSLDWAPKFAAVGCTVIDNSSAWRMDETKKLIVPEINAHELSADDKIIANPNCSTIQMVVTLAPLHEKYTIRRLVISTYQSVTGTGKKASVQLAQERSGSENIDMVYPHRIDMNCIPHCDIFMDNGYTKEEMKLVHETRKILGDDSIRITATAVRVPVEGGHSEAVNIEFANDYNLDDVRRLLDASDGITVQDNVQDNKYPMPLTSNDLDDVFVGRIRRDESNPNSLNMWVVSDNLRKGAATNAVQIAEHLVRNRLV